MKNSVLYFMVLLAFIIFSCDRISSPQDNNIQASDTTLSDLDRLTASIMQDSTNAALYQERALIYLARQNENLALRDVNMAIQLDPGNSGYILTLSDIYMSMGLLENCMESIKRVLVLDPENSESFLKLAELNLILKNYKEAIENANQAIALDKRNPLPYFIRAYTFAEAGDTNNAIKSYLEVVNRDQNHYDAYIQLGLIYSVANNELAIDYFNNALNIDPNSLEALYALAMFYQQTENADLAIATYNKLLLIDPLNVHGHYNLGYVHLVLRGDVEQAITYFAKAAELNPQYYEAIYNQAYCYELSGEYEQARELYNKVLEIEVNYDKAIAGLNRIFGK